MFMKETEVCNHADDTTIHTFGHTRENVIAKLEYAALRIKKNVI